MDFKKIFMYIIVQSFNSFSHSSCSTKNSIYFSLRSPSIFFLFILSKTLCLNKRLVRLLRIFDEFLWNYIFLCKCLNYISFLINPYLDAQTQCRPGVSASNLVRTKCNSTRKYKLDQIFVIREYSFLFTEIQ